MTLTKWAGFHAFTELEQEMHTLLDHFGGRPWLEGFGWRPETDIRRDGPDLVVDVDLPGVDPVHDLTVHISGSVLTIEGTRPSRPEVRDEDLLVQERRCGHFHRAVMLPDGVVAKLVSASYAEGILTVRVPVPDTTDGRIDHHQVSVEVTA